MEDGFRFAIAIVDNSMPDFSDPMGRDFSEYIEISGARFDLNDDGGKEYPIDIHLCTQEELDKFYPLQ